MKPKLSKWKTLRTLSQFFFFALFVYIIWTTKYPLQGFINPSFLFQMDPLIMLITSLAERIVLPALILTIGTLIVTFIFGRVFCGWFCPMGTLMDWTANLSKKWRSYKENDPNQWLKSKYILLGIFFFLALFGWQWIWFFDPITIFVRTFSYNVHPTVNNIVDQIVTQLVIWFPDWSQLELFYYWLKEDFLDIGNPRFPHTQFIAIFFLMILGAVFYQRRFWCRYICPLGGLLGGVAQFSLLKRKVHNCTSNCGLCRHACPTNAIKEDTTYLARECVMCMDCIPACPSGKNSFAFSKPTLFNQSMKITKAESKKASENSTLTRAQFLTLIGSSFLVLQGCVQSTKEGKLRNTILRPPGSLKESSFVDRCVRCGNCMKVCPTNVLQPTILESGATGIWTPKMHFPVSYCEHECNLCGQVCPTGAIEKLTIEKKKLTKIGTALVNRKTCIPWVKDTGCLVCEEHCPVSNKAIKIRYRQTAKGFNLGMPVVDRDLCIGCGICENKCPVDPKRAITVLPS